MVEYAAKESMNESLGDAVAQSRRKDSLAVELQVLAFFEMALFDQEPRIALLRRHAAPDFGHQQAYVVVHSRLRSHITGGSHETVEAGQHPGDQCAVEVNDRRQRIEWAFGQCPLGTGAGGGGRLSRHAANELHEQLGQLEIMDRI